MSTTQRMAELNRDAMQAANEGRYDDAIFKLLQASRMAKALSLGTQEAAVRNNMGIVHQIAGNIDEACSCLRMAARMAGEQGTEADSLASAIAVNLDRLEKLKADRAA